MWATLTASATAITYVPAAYLVYIVNLIRPKLLPPCSIASITAPTNAHFNYRNCGVRQS